VATKSSSLSLLAKLANIIRSPAPASVDADDSEPFVQGDLDQVKLRARIESKRRDDKVRRREFNYLRKVGVKRHTSAQGFGGSSRFTNSSGFPQIDRRLNNRAATVKKIDAIEASMSEQWTRRKTVLADGSPKTDATQIPALKPAQAPSPLASPPQTLKSIELPDANLDFDLDFTEFHSGPAPLGVDLPPPPPAVPENPALQMAALRFAEGDIASAQAALQDVLHDPSAPVEIVDQCALALVDMYRGQGDAARFDQVAIDYAQRFGRSAPEWYSVPQQLGHTSAQAKGHSASGDGSLWACPPILDAQGVARLAASQNGRDVRLVSWEQLQIIGLDAVKPLTALFTDWASQPAAMMFDGMNALNTVLGADTPMGDVRVDPTRWLLRLEALRLQGWHDNYETVALNYCMTYEVSPPSWVKPLSVCGGMFHDGRFPASGAHEGPDSVPFGISDFGLLDNLFLQGELLGDASFGIEHFMAKVHPGDLVVINCRNLIRVDFEAAGRLLNWLAKHEAENVLIQFVNVPRLVGAFFQEVGISEFAEVSVSLK
jgi:ABC-type transporter Mla MlaB component